MKTKFFKFLVIVFVALIVVIFTRDFILKNVVAAAASNITGTKVSLDGFSLSLLNHKITLKGLKMDNPKGFPHGRLIHISKIYADFDLAAILKKDLHFYELTVVLEEAVIVKNNEGKLNVDSLKIAKKENKKKDEASKPVPMRIDKLRLTLGKVVFKDYTQSQDKPTVEVMELGEKEEIYTNITSAEQLVSLIIVGAMKHTAVKGAMIYGAATLAGASFLPVGIAMVALKDASSEKEFAVSYDRVFGVCADVLKRMGSLNSQNKERGELTGNVQGCDIQINLRKVGTKVRVQVSARKMFLAQQKVAGGVLYEISNEL